MISGEEESPPLGVVLIAIWSGLTGCAFLVLGYSQTPAYYFPGGLLLISAYGLWKLDKIGLYGALVAYATTAVIAVVGGDLIELPVTIVLLLYLFTQRRHFTLSNRYPEINLDS